MTKSKVKIAMLSEDLCPNEDNNIYLPSLPHRWLKMSGERKAKNKQKTNVWDSRISACKKKIILDPHLNHIGKLTQNGSRLEM